MLGRLKVRGGDGRAVSSKSRVGFWRGTRRFSFSGRVCRSLLQGGVVGASSSSEDERSITEPVVLGRNRFVPTLGAEDMRDPRGAAPPYATTSGKCMKATHPLSGKDSMEAPTYRKTGHISPFLCDLSARPMPNAKSRKTSGAEFGGFAQPQYISPTTHLPNPCAYAIFEISRLRLTHPKPMPAQAGFGYRGEFPEKSQGRQRAESGSEEGAKF